MANPVRNRIELALCGACLIGSIASMVVACKEPSTTPGFEVRPGMVQDIGTIRQEQSTDADFTLHNHTQSVIRLLDVSTSCGCTIASLSKREISPKSFVVLKLTFRSGKAREAIRVKAIVTYQYESDPESKTTVLEITGSIDPEYEIRPERLDFSEQQAESRRLVLSPKYCKAVAVKAVSCDKRFLTAKVINATSGGDSVVEVSFRPSAFYSGTTRGHVLIFTDNDIQPVAEVPVTVRPRVIIPDRVFPVTRSKSG